MDDFAYTDIEVECGNPDALDHTLQAMVGGPTAVVAGTWNGRSCLVRCFGNVGFVKFAIDRQGYGRVITTNPPATRQYQL